MKLTGALGRENAGMSNRNCDENSQRRKPEVSSAMTIIGGLGDPNNNPAQFVHKLLGFCKFQNPNNKFQINVKSQFSNF